ncbi:hypothetical protein QJS10_CPA06g01281 [Acorus calamus]|uniref:Uncharacterized protein n=1 Tax=Acorus calamus TaxID=4465 RepID=A0AAV9EP00_ACOCL|nr:hypothetical protein QJS10_CPA06g01281 [Acorus calamus]
MSNAMKQSSFRPHEGQISGSTAINNQKIHEGGGPIIDLFPSSTVKDHDSPSLTKAHEVPNLGASQKGGNKKSKQQKNGPGSKKGNNKGSDLIKDFFKDLADDNSTPNRSSSVPSIKSPLPKGGKRD